MAILVAGVGYIGAKLVSDLLAAGEEVVALDNLFSTDLAAIERLAAHPQCHFIRGNVGDRRVLAEAFTGRPITTVYLLAAQPSAHPKAASPRYTESSNLLAPRTLLEAMRRHAARSIVFASSLRVYGNRAAPETVEGTAYGLFRDLSHLSKCYVEKLLEMYAALHGMRCVAARLGIAYGMSPVMKSDDRFITAPNKFCRQLAHGEAIKLYPGSDAVTGFIHVADACTALRAAAGFAGFDGYTPVNVASEWASTIAVAAIAHRAAEGRCTVGDRVPCETSVVHQVGARLAATGFTPRHDLRDGMAEVLEYFRNAVEKRDAFYVGQAH